MEIVRHILIMLSAVVPSKRLRRLAANCCNRLNPFPDEKGCFRSDVAQCAFNILRGGDIEGFEHFLAKYPFPDRWMMYHPRIICVSDINYGPWRIHSIGMDRTFGKAHLTACNHSHNF